MNNATMGSAVLNNGQQIYAVPLGAMPGLTALNASTVAAHTSHAATSTSTASTSANHYTTANNNNNNNNSATGNEGAMTGVNMSPDNASLATGQTSHTALSTSPVLSPGSVKYSPKEFLNFTSEEEAGTGLTPPLMLASPTSIGSASSPLGMDHVFALPKSKKRKLDEISSPTEDPNRVFEDGTANMMTSHVIPLTTNHVTKQQQQDDAIMTTLSSALGASQGTGSALTPVFALTPNPPLSGEEDEPSTSTASTAPLTSSGPKKKDLKITIPSHGLFVAPYPVMLAHSSQAEAADSSDAAKSGTASHVLPATGPATPGGPLLMPPMTPHIVTPLGANFEFPQFFLPQSPFMQSPLMTPTFAPFYSFMPSTPKI